MKFQELLRLRRQVRDDFRAGVTRPRTEPPPAYRPVAQTAQLKAMPAPAPPAAPRRGVIQGYFRHRAQTPAERGAPRTTNGPLPSGGGRPLSPAVLRRMESVFGTGFGDVRIHVTNQASAMGAVAFTHGSNVYFAPGQFNLAQPAGRALLGHELAHVVQQRAGRVRAPHAAGNGIAIVDDAALEAEAERMGRRAADAMAVAPAPPVKPIQRATSRPVRSNQTIQPQWKTTLGTHAMRWEQTGNDAETKKDGWYSGTGAALSKPEADKAMADYIRDGLRDLAAMNIATEVAGYGSEGTHQRLLQTYSQSSAVLAQCIAVFQYVDRHAAQISGLFGVMSDEELGSQTDFLIQLGNQMNGKMGEVGLWSGEEQRAEVALGMQDFREFLKEGKSLMNKKTQAVSSDDLGAFLSQWTTNLDAKSYGRRLESLQTTKVNSSLKPSSELILASSTTYQFVSALEYGGTDPAKYVKKGGKDPKVAKKFQGGTGAVTMREYTEFDELVVGRNYNLFSPGAYTFPQVRVLEKKPDTVKLLVVTA